MLSLVGLMVAAFAAGVLNAIAGGGSFVTFPALLLAGMPAVAANASNTVALFPGQATSAWAYRRNILAVTTFDIRRFLAVSLAGGLAGAVLLLLTPGALFERLVPWLMLFATAVFAIGNFAPAAALARFELSGRGVIAAQFAIAVYGGYFGGGIGFLMLAALTLFGLRDIHAMNGVKILLATIINATAALAFVWAGVVRWPQTLVMAAACVAGGYAGVAGARRISQARLKAAVIVIAATMTAYFFWRGA